MLSAQLDRGSRLRATIRSRRRLLQGSVLKAAFRSRSRPALSPVFLAGSQFRYSSTVLQPQAEFPSWVPLTYPMRLNQVARWSGNDTMPEKARHNV
jgi:hypothetical protein